MTRCISYIRWSKGQQSQGDSRRRQIEASRRWAKERGLVLEESHEDPGVSAFRGRNAQVGALATFLEAVRGGAIPPGTYLLVENLDRLSRETPRVALRTLEAIVDAGIIVVTLADGKEWTPKALDEGFGMMWAMMVMTRAHEESHTKSVRIKAGMANARIHGTKSKRPIGRPKGFSPKKQLRELEEEMP